jgi:beta-lactamase class A
MNKKIYLLKLGVMVFLVGGGYYFGFVNGQKTGDSRTYQEVRLGQNRLINPLLECEVTDVDMKEYKPSRVAVENIIAKRKEVGKLGTASVYFRDLNNGPWFGVDEKAPFSPASLLKVAMMMAYYKRAEVNPTYLTKKLTFEKNSMPLPQYYPPTLKMVENTDYTLEELITRAIEYSDNEAMWLLEKEIGDAEINQVSRDLGIETADASLPDDYMSVKSYATLFRVLYNASYLNKDYSEKALELLARSGFSGGVVGSLPSWLTIAHKFGERELEDGTKELHDCGIVYFPKHPYLMCVMTRGRDYGDLSETIKEISNQVYGDLRTQFKD